MILFVLGLIFVKIGITQTDEIKTTYICPEKFYSIGEKCYHFGEQDVMWLDSHFYCQILNSSLAIVNSYREQHLLRDFFINNTHSVSTRPDRWIDGIYDWQQKRWKWGSSGATINFNTFSKKNLGDKFKWSCIALSGPKKNKWVARKCTEKKKFICETETNIYVEFHLEKRKKFSIAKCTSGKKLNKYERRRCMKLLGKNNENEPAEYAHKPIRQTKDDPDGWVCAPHTVGLGNKCYYFSTEELTWRQAHFECRKNRTKLAIIRNKPQDHNLRRFLNNFIEKHDRWIDGIYDWKTMQWRWAITGQPVHYFGFAKEIFNGKKEKSLAWNAIFMDPTLDNRWNVAEQTLKKRYICQVKAKAVKKFSNIKLSPAQATIIIKKG